MKKDILLDKLTYIPVALVGSIFGVVVANTTDNVFSNEKPDVAYDSDELESRREQYPTVSADALIAKDAVDTVYGEVCVSMIFPYVVQRDLSDDGYDYLSTELSRNEKIKSECEDLTIQTLVDVKWYADKQVNANSLNPELSQEQIAEYNMTILEDESNDNKNLSIGFVTGSLITCLSYGLLRRNNKQYEFETENEDLNQTSSLV